MKNYYKILGVSKFATHEAIKEAYREKAKEYHPDVNSDINSKEQFQLLNEAYHVLKNDKKRKRYDLNYSGNFKKPGSSNYRYRNESAAKKRRTYYYSSKNNLKYKYSKANRKTEKIFNAVLLSIIFLSFLHSSGLFNLILSYAKKINYISGIIIILLLSVSVFLYRKKIINNGES